MNFKLNREFSKPIIILVSSLFLTGCSNSYQWGWYVISPTNKIGISNIEFLLSGLSFTILVSIIAMIFAVLIGLIVSIASATQNKVLNAVNIGYTEIIRAIPLLVMILWVYYGLPVLFNLNFDGIIFIKSENSFAPQADNNSFSS